MTLVKHLNWGRGIHPDSARYGRGHEEPEHPKKKKVVMKMEPKGIEKFGKMITGFFKRGDR